MRNNKVKNSKKTKKRKNWLFKFLSKIVSGIYGKKKLVGLENIPTEPAIIVGNHAQIHGPLSAELKFPYKKSIWCIGALMNMKEAPAYAMDDFFKYKSKKPLWFYKMLAYISAVVSVYMYKHADVIGVYKDLRGITTFKKSLRAIKDGDHIIIFPECHTEFNEIVNEFQTKFVDLARLYFKDSGKEISFVPMYNAAKLKTIVFGKPIKFDSSAPIDEQRKTVCDYLKNQITIMAKELPEHTVIPYANISKKKYPKSK